MTENDLFATIDEPCTDYPAYIRYGEDTNERPGIFQRPELNPVTDPLPDGVEYVSGVYFLTEFERDRLEEVKNPWAVRDSCLAYQLQSGCETNERVLYPIVIETEEADSWQQQIGWIQDFIQKHLPVVSGECDWYNSGNDSIHCHVPLFAGDPALERLRNWAQSDSIPINSSRFTQKQQFRIPGVEHPKTGMKKTPIEPEWSEERIGKEIVTSNPEKPDTYSELVGDWPVWSPFTSEPHDWEPGQPYRDTCKWKSYNNHPFSPYAKTGNGQRSFLTVEIQGSAFWVEGVTYLPCHLKRGIGGDRSFDWNDRYCPVKLSKTDYEKYQKMNLEEHDTLTIIGGKSGSSRIFRTSIETSQEIADAGSVNEAQEILENKGFDTGKSGKNGPKETIVP